jgi:hypothetical protein
MAKKIELDGEAADSITISNLKEHLSYLKENMKNWKKNPQTDDNPDGVWMHPGDVSTNIQMIEHLKAVIDYFGG